MVAHQASCWCPLILARSTRRLIQYAECIRKDRLNIDVGEGVESPGSCCGPSFRPERFGGVGPTAVGEAALMQFRRSGRDHRGARTKSTMCHCDCTRRVISGDFVNQIDTCVGVSNRSRFIATKIQQSESVRPALRQRVRQVCGRPEKSSAQSLRGAVRVLPGRRPCCRL